MPLAMTMTSVFLALASDGGTRKVVQHPTIEEIQRATSVHVLGFTSKGDLLVVESEGSFSIEDWDEVYEVGKAICCDGITKETEEMLDDSPEGLHAFVKSALQEKVQADLHWKD